MQEEKAKQHGQKEAGRQKGLAMDVGKWDISSQNVGQKEKEKERQQRGQTRRKASPKEHSKERATIVAKTVTERQSATQQKEKEKEIWAKQMKCQDGLGQAKCTYLKIRMKTGNS